MASGDKFYIADKATLDVVNGKIGNTTDTGGSSTAGSVFGKLNYLVSQTSSYLSGIYNFVSRIGATNDTQSSSTTTGSVFAKLNYLVIQVSTYLSSVYSWVSKIGNATDTGGSTTVGTVMAKENAVLTEVNKIGNTTDTGATVDSGTLMGKINILLDYKRVMKFVPGILTTPLATSGQVKFVTSEKVYVASSDKIGS